MKKLFGNWVICLVISVSFFCNLISAGKFFFRCILKKCILVYKKGPHRYLDKRSTTLLEHSIKNSAEEGEKGKRKKNLLT